MERRKFSREFKLEAVRLIKERGVSYVQAAEDLGVHQSQLRSWVKAFAGDPEHAFPGRGQMKPQQLEIARLKREVAKLKAERDILKKGNYILDSLDQNPYIQVWDKGLGHERQNHDFDLPAFRDVSRSGKRSRLP